MARVSMRIGWGRRSLACLGIAALDVVLAVAIGVAGVWTVATMVLGFAVLATFFAFVHPHRVLATDDDDDPRLQPGDLVDD